MALPDRNNPYSFDDFLAWRRNIDYYRDDAFLHKVLKRYADRLRDSVARMDEHLEPALAP